MTTMLIVDDQPSVLNALRQCFALEPDMVIIGNAEDGAEAIRLAERLHPDVVLTDIGMPDMDGIAVTIALRKADPHTKVVILSIHDDPTTRARAKAAGADAFVAKHDPAEVLIAAIRRVTGQI